jgi:hypothetical protein
MSKKTSKHSASVFIIKAYVKTFWYITREIQHKAKKLANLPHR